MVIHSILILLSASTYLSPILFIGIIFIAICVLFYRIIAQGSNAKNKDDTKITTVNNKKTIQEGPCVIEYWSLIDFARIHGNMTVGDCTNHTTGEIFKCCAFKNNDNYIYVYFWYDIGVLTPTEIAARKKELKVGRNMNDKYYLYAGKESFVQTVNLELENN